MPWIKGIFPLSCQWPKCLQLLTHFSKWLGRSNIPHWTVLERHATAFSYSGCKDLLNCHYFHLTVLGKITSLLVSPFFLLILTVMIGCGGAFGMTQPRTFLRSVVLLVGRTGWQVLGDGHGLLCFLRCFIAGGTVPSCTNTNYSHNPSRRIKITSIVVRATYWIYHLHPTS